MKSGQAVAGVLQGVRTRLVIEEDVTATPEQMTYARLLDKGMKLGLLMLVITFSIYLVAAASPMGLLETHVAVKDLPKYWSMPVNEYLKHANIQPGWNWITMLDRVDFLNFTGIAFLAGITILCYGRILPIIYRQKDYVYTVLIGCEILVLTLAASGILHTGAH
jgi:hypothetical protein